MGLKKPPASGRGANCRERAAEGGNGLLVAGGGHPGFPLRVVIVQACPRRSRQPAIWHQALSRITTAHLPTSKRAGLDTGCGVALIPRLCRFPCRRQCRLLRIPPITPLPSRCLGRNSDLAAFPSTPPLRCWPRTLTRSGLRAISRRLMCLPQHAIADPRSGSSPDTG